MALISHLISYLFAREIYEYLIIFPHTHAAPSGAPGRRGRSFLNGKCAQLGSQGSWVGFWVLAEDNSGEFWTCFVSAESLVDADVADIADILCYYMDFALNRMDQLEQGVL